MNCGDAIEKLVESARRRAEPDAVLRAHMDVCPACLDRWDSETALSSALRIVQSEAAARRSSRSSRDELMRQFDMRHKPVMRSGWVWTLAAAAVLLAALFAGANIIRRPTAAAEATLAETGEDAQEAGFIAVPYVPPLAAGESVRIVHTELFPAALARLGVNVDPSWNTGLPADLLVGEDGFPRAVRVSDDDSDTGGF